MTAADQKEKENPPSEAQPFQADVAKLLHLMVHSVYSDKSVFLRELIANAADACERLRYEAIAEPALLGDDVKPRITLSMIWRWTSGIAAVATVATRAPPSEINTRFPWLFSQAISSFICARLGPGPTCICIVPSGAW